MVPKVTWTTPTVTSTTKPQQWLWISDVYKKSLIKNKTTRLAHSKWSHMTLSLGPLCLHPYVSSERKIIVYQHIVKLAQKLATLTDWLLLSFQPKPCAEVSKLVLFEQDYQASKQDSNQGLSELF